MKTALLIFLALLCGASAEENEPITAQRAEAIFAWFDQLPFPGLHGAEFVRVWPGRKWSPPRSEPEPQRCLALLLEDGPTTFRILNPDGDEETVEKHGQEPGEEGFVGFRKISLLDEARKFLSEISGPGDPVVVRRRMFSQTFVFISPYSRRAEAEDLALARWCAQQGSQDLALSFLQAARTEQVNRQEADCGESLEINLQNIFSSTLRARAYGAFVDRKLQRPDLLANFQKIVAFCPKADLSNEKEAIRILERMIREDAAHPVLTDAQFAALPPEGRAEELIFRLRDENRFTGRVLRGVDAQPSNGAVRGLPELGLAAAPALAKALGDDSFTREVAQGVDFGYVYRVRDEALAALKAISGCSFTPSPGAAGDQKISASDLARMWWEGVSAMGEENYLIERLATADAHYAEYAGQLMKKYAGDAVPSLIEQICAAADPAVRVTLSKDLWKQDDPRCLDLFARQLVEGRELGERVAAAYGLRYLHDPRAVPAMGAEWEKLLAAKGESNWPAVNADDPLFTSPWSVAEFLATDNAPEASLRLGAQAASLPVEWRARIVSRLADFARGKKVANPDQPNSSAKKAIEDVLHGFLIDTADVPSDFEFESPLVGAGRVCDLAEQGLHGLWPQSYEFDRWLSRAGRTRQCLAGYNVRAQELGEPLQLLPRETPRGPLDDATKDVVSEVVIAPPLDKSEFGARLVALCGAPLDDKSLVAAIVPAFSGPERITHGFALSIARFHDAPGITIQLVSLGGPSLEGKGDCAVRVLVNADARFSTHGTYSVSLPIDRWSNPDLWRSLTADLERADTKAPKTALTIGIRFDLASRLEFSDFKFNQNGGLPDPPPK